mgnify:CR=1 FL=1
MKNKYSILECEINSLDCFTIERAVSDFYQMGYIQGSKLGLDLAVNHTGTYFINGVNKKGEFILNAVQSENGKYILNCIPIEIKEKKNNRFYFRN